MCHYVPELLRPTPYQVTLGAEPVLKDFELGKLAPRRLVAKAFFIRMFPDRNVREDQGC